MKTMCRICLKETDCLRSDIVSSQPEREGEMMFCHSCIAKILGLKEFLDSMPPWLARDIVAWACRPIMRRLGIL